MSQNARAHMNIKIYYCSNKGSLIFNKIRNKIRDNKNTYCMCVFIRQDLSKILRQNLNKIFLKANVSLIQRQVKPTVPLHFGSSLSSISSIPPLLCPSPQLRPLQSTNNQVIWPQTRPWVNWLLLRTLISIIKHFYLLLF